MSKRVAVLSHFGFDNFGNRLQSSAVVSLLQAYGIDPTVIAPCASAITRRAKNCARLVLPGSSRLARQRLRNFMRFSKRYTPYRYTARSKMEAELAKYDAVVLGSDQVWSPFFLSRTKEPLHYFLGFVPAEKKIALAPSFGVSEIPPAMQEMFVQGIGSFTRVSVREEAGANIVFQLIGKKAQVLCDPTLAVGVDTWRSMARGGAVPHESYLLTYCLGKWDSATCDAVVGYAGAHGMRVIDLMDAKSDAYACGPAEFLALIDGASYFVTDSFHGTVFASLFHTSYAVTQRIDEHGRDMFSRLDTLLATLSCGDRVFDAAAGGRLPAADVDWERVDACVQRERRAFVEYLEEELERCGVL